MAKAIMVQGTMSNSGKTFVTAGLCRVFKQDGYKVAPFKSQNMALNSYITEEGLEIGRAQAMQAEAAMIPPTHWMNPILLKPTSNMGSQVIVNGEVYDNLSAQEYYKMKDNLAPEVMKAFNHLAAENDIIVIEGAGSPAEINLAENDIVNMGMAKMADASVILVADIDRGGVFASAYGTIKLLPQEDQERFCGIVINKFRGDVEILKPGLKMLEDLTDKPVLGVLPMEKIDVDDEDSLSDRLNQRTFTEGIDVAVIRLPHISNFTDFSVFELIDGVSLRYVSDKRELGEPDLILLPGTKNTMADMEWLIESGLESKIIRASKDTRIIGICGGFQILGKELHDPEHVEHGGDMRGLGLLDTSTVFQGGKTRTRIHGCIREEQNLYGLENRQLEGYEIHMGATTNLGGAVPMIELEDGRTDAYMTPDGRIWGSYLHGIFDNEDLVFGLVHDIMREKGINPGENHLSVAEYKEIQYNKLADLIRNNLDMNQIYRILFDGEKPQKDFEKEVTGETAAGADEAATGCGGLKDDTSGKGCVHIYCGDGKGKTTCVIGLCVRAAGAGKKVLLHQFLKDNTSSERTIIDKLPGVTVMPGAKMDKFTFQMNEEELQALRESNDANLARLCDMAKDYDMLILDESVYAMDMRLLSEDKLIEWLEKKPEHLEVVMSGRNPSDRLKEHADYISEIKKIKHPFDQGLSSRIGIEK
ncbi:MAG TPA: cobyric acid synthase [Candidatus Anaerobutyricum stercoris]|uniref:Cobyric acid synthase n=1 Tax=Candidatus Anaerobutyricum stercoris TaxID=2838457 RepID=A0A9D2J7Z6_9FIRM|nr:cobyric acid synthase [Candidatus Anaerobutyricum stercoris]